MGGGGERTVCTMRKSIFVTLSVTISKIPYVRCKDILFYGVRERKRGGGVENIKNKYK